MVEWEYGTPTSNSVCPLRWSQRPSKQSATIIWLDSRFAHDDGLPCRNIELRQIVPATQVLAVRSIGDLSAIAWFRQLQLCTCIIRLAMEFAVNRPWG